VERGLVGVFGDYKEYEESGEMNNPDEFAMYENKIPFELSDAE
jgi:hypothetical protein